MIPVGDLASQSARPFGFRLRSQLAVDIDVAAALMPETDEPFDLRNFRDRVHVAPNQIRKSLVAELDRPIGGLSLVRTARFGRARAQKLHPDVFLGNIVTHRMDRKSTRLNSSH